MEVKDQYIDVINKEYDKKTAKEKSAREKILLYNKSKDKSFTQQDLHIMTEEKSQAKLQNIISSIPKIHSNKILLFSTLTFNPNTATTIYTNMDKFDENFKQQLHLQDKEFKSYIREFRRLKDKNYVYIYELTENLNFHNHQISYFNNIDEIKLFIKYSFIAKKNNPLYIGRTELKFDYKFKEQILNLFKDFKIKLYGELTIEPFKDFYIIPQSKVAEGNFIIIDFIEDEEKNKEKNEEKYIEKYLFKYLLKQKIKDSDELVESLDSKTCNVLGINQFTYSQNFFYNNLDSKTLFRLNDKLYSLNKYLKLDIDKNTILYHTVEFLKSGDIYMKDNIYYFQNEENVLLDLNIKYTKKVTKTKFEALLYKYEIEDFNITRDESFELFATQIFHTYNYSKKEISKVYEVDTIEELSDYLKLEDDLIKEESQNERTEQLEDFYTQIDTLYYQQEQILDNMLLLKEDIDTLNLINTKLESISPSKPFLFF